MNLKFTLNRKIKWLGNVIIATENLIQRKSVNFMKESAEKNMKNKKRKILKEMF